MAKAFTVLEKNILKSKGVSDAEIKKMTKVGIAGRADFATVGATGNPRGSRPVDRGHGLLRRSVLLDRIRRGEE